jgi:zinc protease
MSRWHPSVALALLLAFASTNAHAEEPKSKPAAPAPGKGTVDAPANKAATPPAKDPVIAALDRLALSIQRRTLANGLRVVLNPDPTSPTVAVAVTYDVGSRNEVPGRSGFAHLFEHMLFQGSKHVPKGAHFTLVSERGGSLNGTTSADRTNYFEVVPASELELLLWLESDRMRWLDVSEENFENQRAVVKEEYRMRVDNAPYARGFMRLEELVFSGYQPYAHPTIGSMEDLDAAKLPWVQDFYERYYGPNNAVLSIAGNFDVDQAMALVEKYFGPAERREPPKYEPPAAPAQAKPQREKLEDKNARTEAFLAGYLIPPARTPDHYALEMLALVLGDGESSRFYQELVKRQELAQQASAYTRDYRGLDMFGTMVILNDRAKLPEIEKAVDAELEKLKKAPPSAAELDRVKRRLRAAYVFGMQTNLRRATELGEFELFWGDARGIARELERYLAVTPADVKRVAEKYLVPSNRAVVEIVPAATAQKPPVAAPPAKEPAPTKAPASSPAAPKSAKNGAVR